MAQEGRALSVIIHPDGVSPSDSQDTFDYVNRLFRKSNPEDVIADFTGGTKPMSVGMINSFAWPTTRSLSKPRAG